MAVSRTQAVSANASSVAISSTSSGDLIVVFAYDSTAVTIPTLPAGFTSFDTGSGNLNAARAGYKVSSGSDTSSGTWTNATNVVCHVYAGAMAIGTGHVLTPSSGTTLTYATITLQDATGNSWIAGFGGAKAASSGMNGSTASLTNRTNQTTVNGLDSGAGVTSFASESITITGSGRTITETVEIRSAIIAFAGGTGTFTLTGNAAQTLEFATATGGTFAVTGNAAQTLEFATASSGTFTLTGGAAIPIILAAAASGSFSVTGNAAKTLEFATATGGTFAVAGGAAIPVIFSAATDGKFIVSSSALIAFWNMNDFLVDDDRNVLAALDSSVHGIDLVCDPSPFGPPVPGKFGDAVEMPSDVALLGTDIGGIPRLAQTGSFTFWFWVSGLGIGVNPSYQGLASMTSEVSPGGTDFFNVRLIAASSKIRLYGGGPLNSFIDWPSPITDSDWHFIAISWDQDSGLWKLSVDGDTPISSALDGAPDPGPGVECLLLEGVTNQLFDAVGYKNGALTDALLSYLWYFGTGKELTGTEFDDNAFELYLVSGAAGSFTVTGGTAEISISGGEVVTLPNAAGRVYPGVYPYWTKKPRRRPIHDDQEDEIEELMAMLGIDL